MMKRSAPLLCTVLTGLAVGLLSAPHVADAALSDGYAGRLALTGNATAFTEDMSGNTNPSLTFSNVATYGTLTISYGPYFSGQSYVFDPDVYPVPVQTGNRPSSPLGLATADSDLSAIIEDDNDPAAPSNPVIGGSIGGSYSFVGPIAILFSMPLQAVELTVGNFAAPGQTILEAFDSQGASLGTVLNGVSGYEQFDLSAVGQLISGISLRSSDNSSPTGIGVSGLGVFERTDVIPPVSVPAPGPTALLAALVLVLRGKRRHG